MLKFEELVKLINTKHPEWKTLTVRDLKEISGYSHDASRQALNIVRPNEIQTPKQKTNGKKKTPSPSYSPTIELIDDPVELLTSTCVRELNKKAPDSRWASILLTLLDKTNKLEYKDVEEAQLQNQLRTKSISELISSKKQLIKL